MEAKGSLPPQLRALKDELVRLPASIPEATTEKTA